VAPPTDCWLCEFRRLEGGHSLSLRCTLFLGRVIASWGIRRPKVIVPPRWCPLRAGEGIYR
jgi:hypothetical protein